MRTTGILQGGNPGFPPGPLIIFLDFFPCQPIIVQIGRNFLAMIEFKGVNQWFGSLHVLKDVDLAG
jgi:hypothetical protein